MARPMSRLPACRLLAALRPARLVPGSAGALRRGLRVAVIQPLPGIGDMVWHLPHLRAIAAHVGRPVTLVTKPGSRADELLAAEPSVAGILWLHGRTKAGGAGGGPRRLVAELRDGGFDAAVLLHHSVTLARVAARAGIACRLGYGIGWQRLFLTHPPFLPTTPTPVHPFRQASAWLAAAGIAMAADEPDLPVTPEAAATVAARLGVQRYVALGIGSSEANKQWGASRFAELAEGLRAVGWPALVLVGGPAEAALAADIQARLTRPAIEALGWPLDQVAALLAGAACYVGNDTGAANIAAATGTSTFCLFGATEPFDHSRRIVPITPPGGVDRVGGMARIAVADVLGAIAAHAMYRDAS